MLKAKFKESSSASREYGGAEPISIASVPGMTTLRNMSSGETIGSNKTMDGL